MVKFCRRIMFFLIGTFFVFRTVFFYDEYTVAAAETGKESVRISKGEFLKELLESAGIDMGREEEANRDKRLSGDYSEYREAAERTGILTGNGLKNLNRPVSLQEAVSMVVRCGDYLRTCGKEDNGTGCIPKLKESDTAFILEYRIGDSERISKKYRSEVARAYAAGIIRGSSDGSYTVKRYLKPRRYLRRKEAGSLLARFTVPEKRFLLSASYVSCRKGSEEGNLKYYNCLYQTFPNEFYDWEFYYMKLRKGAYGRSLFDLETEGAREKDYGRLISYAPPTDLEKYYMQLNNGGFAELSDIYVREELGSRIQEYLEAIFNVDYRTIDENRAEFQKKTVGNSIISTWEKSSSRKVPEVSEYIAAMKKNKTVLESETVAVDTDNIYAYGEWLYVRCYVKWRPLSGEVTCGTFGELDGLLFTVSGGLSDELSLSGVNMGEWHENWFDVMLKPKSGLICGTIISDYYHDTHASFLE